jgi:hypothetical protein
VQILSAVRVFRAQDLFKFPETPLLASLLSAVSDVSALEMIKRVGKQQGQEQ